MARAYYNTSKVPEEDLFYERVLDIEGTRINILRAQKYFSFYHLRVL